MNVKKCRNFHTHTHTYIHISFKVINAYFSKAVCTQCIRPDLRCVIIDVLHLHNNPSVHGHSVCALVEGDHRQTVSRLRLVVELLVKGDVTTLGIDGKQETRRCG